MYNFIINLMRVKIIIVAVLTIVILVLAFLLFRPGNEQKLDENSSSIKPKSLTNASSATKKQTNEEFGISFEYPANYELTESTATSLYGSSEAVVYTFTDTTRPYIAPSKLSFYKILEIKTIEELVQKLKLEYPDIYTRECLPKRENNICVALLTKKGEKQPPFHFIKQYDFGLTATTMDFPEKDTVLYDDNDQNGVSLDDPLAKVFTTLERIQ